MKKTLKDRKFSTIAVHGGKGSDSSVRPHVVPIYQTVNFEYENFEQGIRVGKGEEPGYFYTRHSNPTIDALNDTVAMLEGAERAFSFASGMAAITSAVHSLIKPGEHVLAGSVLYGGTYDFLANYLPRLGIDISFVDVWDLQKVENAFRKSTRILYLEPVMNPTLLMADVPQLAEIARDKGSFVIVDNTFTPPYLFTPLKNGAHAVLHSTTKFLGGHGDTIGGVVAGSGEYMEKVVQMGRVYGGVMSPMNAWLTLRGIRTLDVRLERSGTNAAALARYLDEHPKICKVYYPGLDSHPQHALAERLLAGFGSMVSFEVAGGLEAVRSVLNAFQVITSTVSLGEVDTVASHPASSSHRKMSPELRERYGITDGLIRLSVGIEGLEDLVEDIDQSLEKA